MTNLHNASLEFAVSQPDSSAPLVNNVEQCSCPQEYTVISCYIIITCLFSKKFQFSSVFITHADDSRRSKAFSGACA